MTTPRAKATKRRSGQPKTKTVARHIPKTGKRAVALAVRKALLRKPRVIPWLAELFNNIRHFQANRHVFIEHWTVPTCFCFLGDC